MVVCRHAFRRELFKRDRRKLPYLTDLCFAASPVALPLHTKKPAHKAPPPPNLPHTRPQGHLCARLIVSVPACACVRRADMAGVLQTQIHDRSRELGAQVRAPTHPPTMA
jgi:hypothetical protein